MKGEITMKYKIKPEFYDEWGAYEGIDIVTADEINELSVEWDVSVEELMEQVEEV